MIFQFGATLLDLCVLAILNRGDAYGYYLTQHIKTVIEVSESTLYPVLRRLQKNGCLITYEKLFKGRNRIYYHITDIGKIRYSEYLSMWNTFSKEVDNIIIGGDYHE